MKLKLPDWLAQQFNPVWRAIRDARDKFEALAQAEAPVLSAALAQTAVPLIIALLEFLVAELARRFGHQGAAEELLALLHKLKLDEQAAKRAAADAQVIPHDGDGDAD